MAVETQLQDITQTIQLAIAPVFLLSAIGTTLAVLSTRLGRVVDRARLIESQLPTAAQEQRPGLVDELKRLDHRARLILLALTSGTVAALLVCLLIAVAFVGYLFAVKLGPVVAVVFICAVVAIVVAFILFLREVYLATATLRFSFPPEVLVPDEDLHHACYHGHLERVRELLASGADPNAPAAPGKTFWASAAGPQPRPLNCVVIAWHLGPGHLEIARLLLSRGASVDDTVMTDHAAEAAGSPTDGALRALLREAQAAAAPATPAAS